MTPGSCKLSLLCPWQPPVSSLPVLSAAPSFAPYLLPDPARGSERAAGWVSGSQPQTAHHRKSAKLLWIKRILCCFMASSGTTEIHISSAIFQSSKNRRQFHTAVLSYPGFSSTARGGCCCQKSLQTQLQERDFCHSCFADFSPSSLLFIFLSNFGKTTSLRLLLPFFFFFLPPIFWLFLFFNPFYSHLLNPTFTGIKT